MSEHDKNKHKKDKEQHEQVIKIDANTKLQQEISNASSANEQRDIVFKYIMNNLRGKYNISDGREVIISGKTAKKYVSHPNDIKFIVTPQLAELLNKSKLLGIIDIKHKTFKQFAYYETMFEVNNKTYKGLLNIGIAENGQATLYELNKIRCK